MEFSPERYVIITEVSIALPFQLWSTSALTSSSFPRGLHSSELCLCYFFSSPICRLFVRTKKKIQQKISSWFVNIIFLTSSLCSFCFDYLNKDYPSVREEDVVILHDCMLHSLIWSTFWCICPVTFDTNWVKQISVCFGICAQPKLRG